MPVVFRIKQGDTNPDLIATLVDEAGNPPDLVGATVRFHMGKAAAGEVKVDAAAIVVDTTLGIVRHEWVPTDTDTAGDWDAEFEVTFSNGMVKTFPNDGYILVQIVRQIA